jgi:hypothetical protein
MIWGTIMMKKTYTPTKYLVRESHHSTLVSFAPPLNLGFPRCLCSASSKGGSCTAVQIALAITGGCTAFALGGSISSSHAKQGKSTSFKGVWPFLYSMRLI